MIWDTSTSQIHHHSNHLTLSEHKNKNFQSIEKLAYMLINLTQVFVLVLSTLIRWCSWKHRPYHRWRVKRKIFRYNDGQNLLRLLILYQIFFSPKVKRSVIISPPHPPTAPPRPSPLPLTLFRFMTAVF